MTRLSLSQGISQSQSYSPQWHLSLSASPASKLLIPAPLAGRGADHPCRRIMQPEYAAVAKSWAGQKNNKDHFFAVLDFENGQAVYQKVSARPGAAGSASRAEAHGFRGLCVAAQAADCAYVPVLQADRGTQRVPDARARNLQLWTEVSRARLLRRFTDEA